MKNKKLWFISGSILLLVGLFLCTISLALNNWNIEKLDVTPDFIEQTKTFEVNEVHSFDVKTVNQDIIIQKSKDNNIHITYSENKNKKYKIEQSNGNLSIHSYDTRNLAKQIIDSLHYHFYFKEDKIKVIIELPEYEYQMIKLKTTNGNIEIKDIRSKQIKLDNINGSTKIKQIQATDLTSHSTNGNITLTSTIAPNINLKNVNGSIKGEELTVETATVKSTNGNIRLEIIGDEDDYKRDIQTINGTSNITNRTKGDFELKLKSINGNIKVTFKN